MSHQSKSLKVIVAVLLIGLIQLADQVESFKVEDCSKGQQNAQIKSVSISSCPGNLGDSCELKKGQNASIEIDFETVKPFSQADVKIYGLLGPVKLPFNLQPSNACGNYGFDCPVKEHSEESLKISLPVLKTYPSLGLKIELNLLNESGSPIVCIQFPAKIANQS